VEELTAHAAAALRDRTGPDGSEAVRAEEIEVELQLAVAKRTAALLAQFDEQRCPAGRAVEGAGPTLAALAEGRVRVLLLAMDTDPARTAWFGPDVTEVAADRQTLQRAGVNPQQGPLADVAIRAALLTGAHVRTLPSPGPPEAPREGIGALCRYARSPPDRGARGGPSTAVTGASSALDDAEWPQAGDAVAKPGVFAGAGDFVDVLVGEGCLFGQSAG
jgi:hypothetical protein